MSSHFKNMHIFPLCIWFRNFRANLTTLPPQFSRYFIFIIFFLIFAARFETHHHVKRNQTRSNMHNKNLIKIFVAYSLCARYPHRYRQAVRWNGSLFYRNFLMVIICRIDDDEKFHQRFMLAVYDILLRLLHFVKLSSLSWVFNLLPDAVIFRLPLCERANYKLNGAVELNSLL